MKRYGPQNRPYLFKFLKGCILQILLGPFLNTLFVNRTSVDLNLILWCHYLKIISQFEEKK